MRLDTTVDLSVAGAHVSKHHDFGYGRYSLSVEEPTDPAPAALVYLSGTLDDLDQFADAIKAAVAGIAGAVTHPGAHVDCDVCRATAERIGA